MVEKIKVYLLALLVLTLGFGQLLRLEISGVPLLFHDFLILIWLSYHALFHSRPILAYLQKQKWFWLLLLAIFIGTSRGIAIHGLQNLAHPALYTARLLAYLLFYVSLRAMKVSLNPHIFTLAIAVATMIGLLQYLLIPDMRIFAYLGYDDHLHRLVLPHYDPTWSATMLALGILFLQKHADKFALVLLPFTYIAFALTYARAVWLALALALIIKSKSLRITVTVLIVAFSIIWLLPTRFGEGNNLRRLYSVTSRVQNDAQFVRSGVYNLLLGSGYNTFAIADVEANLYPDRAHGPNNSYLALLINFGLLGTVAWLLFLNHLRGVTDTDGALLLIMIASLFNNAMFYPFALLWLFLMYTTRAKAQT